MESGHDRTLVAPSLGHAAIGNGRVLALVSPTSAIEWLCLPRFDSPSLFARLLDAERGGVFRVLEGDDEIQGALAYLPNTNVSRVRFERGACAWEVLDFAPRIPRGLGVEAPLQLIRLIRPLRGAPSLRVDLDLRPDYARRAAYARETPTGVVIEGADAPVHVDSNLPAACLAERAPFALEGPVFVSLSWGPPPSPPTLASVDASLAQTVAGWRAWAKTCALPTFAPAAVLRSALCLKLHASEESGAIIAAATTSIPEAMGTERTWDYRYCWLRDAAFVVEALRRLSHLAEGERFIAYLRRTIEASGLQPVYGIGGETELCERMLPHLAGFGGNGHVRVGNAAFAQRQNDLMGEIVLCLDTVLGDPRIVEEDPHAGFPLVQRLVEQAISAADQDDTGIWEFRTQLRPYTFSRAMCWAALHRGAMIARRLGFQEEAERWDALARAERETILERGYNAELGFFTQALDGEFPDAANLLLPTIGIVDARDARFVSTVSAYEKRLVENGLMLRYRNPDDFGETTSAFTICSFWWAEALALIGRLEDAVALFERLMTHANPVGLFSEDVDPASGARLGNFPQAYTHVGLIHAATTIGELLEARDGRVRAWV